MSEILIMLIVLINSSVAIYILLKSSIKDAPCPNCKKTAKINEKGYDYHSEYYCSNCGYEYDFVKG